MTADSEDAVCCVAEVLFSDPFGLIVALHPLYSTRLSSNRPDSHPFLVLVMVFVAAWMKDFLGMAGASP